MRRHPQWASLIGVLVAYLSGCAVMATVPSGEVVYGPPVVVEEPAVSVWGWWPWPHYDVEHHYVVERDSCERLPRAHHSSSPPEVEVDRILELQSPALTTRHIYSSVGPLPARVDAVSQGVDGRRVSDSM